MILRLAREQIRSQWRFTAWMVALVGAAVGLAMYAMATTATSIAFEDGNPTVGAWGQENVAGFLSDGDSPDTAPTDAASEFVTETSLNDLDALLNEASGIGPVVAQRGWMANSDLPHDNFWVVAPLDSGPWAPYLLTGDIAGPGQVVVRWDVAKRLHLDIGDTLALTTVSYFATTPRTVTLRVNGTMKDGGERDSYGPYRVDSPEFVANWSDSAALDQALRRHYPAAIDDAWLESLQTTVGWNGDNGILASYRAGDTTSLGGQHGFAFSRASGRIDGAGSWSLLIAGLLTLSVMVAAVAMGRAQAGARARWTATARVMGARRGTLVGASLVEALVVGVVSGALGSALGAGAVAASLAGLRRTHPNSILPLAPSVPAVLYGAAIGAAVILALLTAAMPAFWATRVEPVAALKPVTPLTDRNLSRDVSPWWPTGIAGAAVAVLIACSLAEARLAPGVHVALGVVLRGAWIAAAVGGVALSVQLARTMVLRSGRALQRSKRAWAIVAGEGLIAHGRLFTFAALSSLVFAAIAAASVTSSAQAGWDPTLYRGSGEPTMPGLREWWGITGGWLEHVGAVGPLFAMVTGVAVAVTLSARQALGLDAATESALGLRGGHSQIAATARQFVPTAVALVVGAILGVAGWMLAHDLAGVVSPDALVFSWGWHFTALGHAIVATAFMLSYLLPVALAGGLVVGLATRPGTPVEVLRRNVR
jgi:hypothetical protein